METLKEKLERMSKIYVVDKTSGNIFLDIPEIFGGRTKPLLELIESFNLKLDGSIGVEGGIGGIPDFTFITDELKGMENPTKEYKKKLKELKYKMNKFLRQKYGEPLYLSELITAFFRPKIWDKIFSAPPTYSVDIKPDLNSNLLIIY